MGLATPSARAPNEKDGSNSQLLRKGPLTFPGEHSDPLPGIRNPVQRSAAVRIKGDHVICTFPAVFGRAPLPRWTALLTLLVQLRSVAGVGRIFLFRRQCVRFATNAVSRG